MRRFFCLFALVVFGCASTGLHDGMRENDECGSSTKAHVEVHSSTHRLVLCSAATSPSGSGMGRVAQTFSVRLAKHGVGKSREGDGKLPLGEYDLGDAVPSAKFGQFLAVGYPTPVQRSQGLTGSAVGVHGPAREVRWLGGLVNTFDTTEGCVGLATDEDVSEIARFVHDHPAHLIVIN